MRGHVSECKCSSAGSDMDDRRLTLRLVERLLREPDCDSRFVCNAGAHWVSSGVTNTTNTVANIACSDECATGGSADVKGIPKSASRDDSVAASRRSAACYDSVAAFQSILRNVIP